jgi:hypothetical protein
VPRSFYIEVTRCYWDIAYGTKIDDLDGIDPPIKNALPALPAILAFARSALTSERIAGGALAID